MNLSEIIKNYRDENRVSMREFAKRAGLSKAYISILENGNNPSTNKKASPTIESLKKVADAMDMELDELFRVMDDMDVLVNTKPKINTYSDEEESIIKKYRTLDEYGKKSVNATLDLEYNRCKEQNKKGITEE